jgi:hypothetical protein
MEISRLRETAFQSLSASAVGRQRLILLGFRLQRPVSGNTTKASPDSATKKLLARLDFNLGLNDRVVIFPKP